MIRLHDNCRPTQRLQERLRVCSALFAGLAGLAALPAPVQAVTFQEVCQQATTVNCWGFESESEMYYTWKGEGDTFLRNHQNGNNDFGLDRQSQGNAIANTENAAGRYVYPTRDSTRSEFPGGTSLKFTMLSQSGPKTSGDFTPVFKQFRQQDGSWVFARFGPGGEFWVRFALNQSPELLTTRLRDESGGGFGGVKRLIVHGESSSSSLEETIQDLFERRLPQMYSDSGTEDYGIQDVIGCTREDPDVASSYTEPPCRKFKANEWVVYQMHVRVGNNTNRNNGLVELYLNDEASPIIRVTNADHWAATGAPYAENTVWTSGDGYGKLSFTLFSTRKDQSQTHPEAYMWIDNVVISKTRVPRLSASSSGDTLPPAPPTNLRRSQ